MRFYNEKIEDTFLRYIDRICEPKFFYYAKRFVNGINHDKTPNEFIKLILEFAKANISGEQYDVIERKISQFNLENIKLDEKDTQPILKRLTEKNNDYLWKTREERKNVLKDIYDYCMLVEWKTKALEYLASILKTDRFNIRGYASMYARENFSNEEYESFKKIRKKFTDRNNKLEIIGINKILKDKTGKITDMLWETPEERIIVLKFIYNYWVENGHSIDKMEDFSNWLGLLKNNVELLVKEYAIEFLVNGLEQYNQIKSNHNKMKSLIARADKGISRYKKIFDNLLNVQTLDEIISIINFHDVNLHSLRYGVFDYVIVYHNGNMEIREQLKLKIKMYTDYILETRREQKQKEFEEEKNKQELEKLSIAISVVTEFINDFECRTIGEFCQKNNINKEIFEGYITIIKEREPNLYNIYNKKIIDMNKQRYSIIITQIKKIVEGLKYGVEENCVKHAFDIIDYYSITKISLEKILELSKEILLSNEYNILRRFVNENINNQKNIPSIKSQIMSEKVIIKYEKDKRGQPILGTEEIFSNEEKEKLFDYLNEKKIPINLKTYNIVYRRYRDGILDLNTSVKSK